MLTTHHAHKIRKGKIWLWHWCWRITAWVMMARWSSSWCWFLFFNTTVTLWSYRGISIITSCFFLSFLLSWLFSYSWLFFYNLKLFRLSSLKLVSRFLLVHLNYVISYIVDIICSITITVLKRCDRIHKMFIGTHWSNIWAWIDLLLFYKTLLRCLEIIVYRSNVEGANSNRAILFHF